MPVTIVAIILKIVLLNRKREKEKNFYGDNGERF